MGPRPGSANVQRPSAAGASWACKSPPGRQRAREAALENPGSRGPRAKPFGAAVSSARPSPAALLAQRPAEPVRGERGGAAGSQNGAAARSAERERREPEGAGKRGLACARRAWVGVRRTGAAAARGRGTPATLDSASPDAGVAAPRIMVSGGSAPPPASFFLSATGREGAEEAAVRELRVRPLEPVAVCGLGRAARACGGGGERLGAVGGRGTAGLGRLVRVRGPDRPLRRPPRSAPCCMHAAGRSWDARQTAPFFRGGCSRAAPAAPRSRSGERRPPRAGPISPRKVQALGR